MAPARFTQLSGADGLRGLACLIVMVMHATSFTYPAAIPYLTGCGKIGVWLFFTLSAFLLTVRLSSSSFGSATLLDYAIGRVLRIYPLFVIALAVHFAMGIGIGSWREFWQAATLSAGPVHFWTIPVEMTFYALLPAMVLVLQRVQQGLGNRAMIILVMTFMSLHQMAWPFWETPDNNISLSWYLPTFLFGVVAALLRDVTWPGQRVRETLIVSVLVGVMLSSPLARYAILSLAPTPYLMNKHLFFGLAYAALIWCVVCSPTRLTAVFDTRSMVWMGKVSYSTYLFHWVAMHQLLKLLPNAPATVAILVLAAFVVGGAIHVAAERPLAVLRHGFMERMLKTNARGRAQAPAPAPG